jgi:hypothetical protein
MARLDEQAVAEYVFNSSISLIQTPQQAAF